MTVSAVHATTATPAVVTDTWQLFKVMLDAVLNARHHIGQVQTIEALLRQSNACETTEPARAEALRREAAILAG